MRVVLVHPSQVVERDYIDYPVFTGLGVWSLAAALRAKGHEVRVVDAFALSASDYAVLPAGARFGVDDATLLAEIGREPYEALVLHRSVFDAQEAEPATTARLLRALRARGEKAPLILADCAIGGMHALDTDPAPLFADPAEAPDLYLRYEAEIDLPDFLDAWAREGARALPGSRVIAGRRADLDVSTALGTYEGVDLAAYRAFLARTLAKEGRANPFSFTAQGLPIKISRGCPYACRFCTSGLALGGTRGVRALAPEAVAALIDKLVALAAPDTLVLLDEAANTASTSFGALLEAATARGLRLAIPNGLRADHLEDEHVAALARVSSLLSLSPECGDEEQSTRLLGKRQEWSHIERVCRAAKRHGLPIALHFIVGWPGESRASIHRTLGAALDLHTRYGAIPWLQFAVPLPGTPLFAEAQAKGFLPAPLPSNYAAAFAERPLLKDGACEIDNDTLIGLVAALKRRVHERPAD